MIVLLLFWAVTEINQKWQNWEFGKYPEEIPQIPRHLGRSQVSWGNSPNSHVEGNLEALCDFTNILPGNRGVWARL